MLIYFGSQNVLGYFHPVWVSGLCFYSQPMTISPNHDVEILNQLETKVYEETVDYFDTNEKSMKVLLNIGHPTQSEEFYWFKIYPKNCEFTITGFNSLNESILNFNIIIVGYFDRDIISRFNLSGLYDSSYYNDNFILFRSYSTWAGFFLGLVKFNVWIKTSVEIEYN
jgi:hypothetical protein